MRRRATGLTILEMIVTLGVVTMAMEIAVPITRWAIIDVNRAQREASANIALDRATEVLRQDVWQAREIQIPAPGRLVLLDAAGDPIHWHVNPDGVLSRVGQPANQQTWTTELKDVSFTRDGALLVVTISGSPGRTGSTLSMISPTVLYACGQP